MVLKKCAISAMTLAVLASGVVPVMANNLNENSEVENKMVSEKPTINVTDKVIEKGDKFNPLEGVTARESNGTDLTRHVIVTHNNVDVNRVGVYRVGYAVLASNGIRTDVEIKVTVRDGENTVIKTDIIVKDVIIGKGSSFDPMKGVQAIDISGKDITQYVLVSGDEVNTNIVGKYTVKYTVLDTEGNRVSKTRVVEVKEGVQVEKSTEIIAKDLVLEKGSSFDPMKGVQAIDISGKDITQHVLVVENTVDTTRASVGTVKYLVLDTEGNRVYKTIKVTITDGDKVACTEILASDKTLNVGDNFDPMKDVQAIDISGKDITQYVLVTKNNVNVNKPGSYEVTYLVLDTENVRVSKTIKVDVVGEAVDITNNVYDVIEKISKLDKIIEYTDKDLVEEARKAYDALTDEEKSLVTNIDILINAEAIIAELENAKSVKEVIDMIDAIGDVSDLDYSDSVAIRNARVAYDALTPENKKLVTNIDKLIEAEKNIQGTVDRVHNVINLINALPEDIQLEHKSQVEEARRAYDALTEVEKKGISKYTLSILTSSEAIIAELENAKSAKEVVDVIDDIDISENTLTSSEEKTKTLEVEIEEFQPVNLPLVEEDVVDTPSIEEEY